MTWHAVDGAGQDLATGRVPNGPGRSDPATALAAAPVASWPLAVVSDDGRRLTLAAALGPGGGRVERLLDTLAATGAAAGFAEADVETLARDSPGGRIGLPLDLVSLPAAMEAVADVEPPWLEAVERRRRSARDAVLVAGRGTQLEAAVHITALVATDTLDPADDGDAAAHAASGAQLWLLTGAVASALAGHEPDPFAPWATLVTAGYWPVGPAGGRLVVVSPVGSGARVAATTAGPTATRPSS